MHSKFFSAVDSCCNRDHRNAVVSPRRDVGRRIADHAYCRVGAKPLADLRNASGKDVAPQLTFVGKRAKSKVIAKSGRSDLDPADFLKIPRGDSEQLAARMERSNEFRHTSARFRSKALPMTSRFRRHHVQGTSQLAVESSRFDALAYGDGPQDTDVSVAMPGHAIDRGFYAEDLAESG